VTSLAVAMPTRTACGYREDRIH